MQVIETDPQRRRHASSSSARSTPSRRSPSSPTFQWRVEQRVARRRAQPLDDQGLLRRTRRGHLARAGVRGRRRRAGDPLWHRHRPEPGRVPAARARSVPDDLARLRRRGARGAADARRVDARGRHGRPGRARARRRRPQPLHATSASPSPSRATPPRRSCARSSRARPRAPPSSTRSRRRARQRGRRHPLIGIPRPGRDASRPAGADAPQEIPHAIQLSARTPSGAASSRSPSSSPAARRAAAGARPRRQLPLRGHRGAAARPATSPRPSPPSSAASASTRCTTSSSPPSRLARGDASLAIGVNMHMALLGNIARRWRARDRRCGDVRRAAAFGETLTEVVHAGDDHRDRRQRARPGPDAPVTTRTRDGVVAGASTARKIFCTMSPAATVLYTTVSFVDDDGRGALRLRPHPRARPGVVDPRRLGRARHARLRQPLGDVRRRRAARVRAARRVPGRQPRRRTWSPTSPPASSTPRRRSASPSRPTRSRRGRSRTATLDARSHARGRERDRPRRGTGDPLARGGARRGAPRRGDGALEEVVRRGPGGEDVRQRGRRAGRRPRARAVRRRRLQHHAPARAPYRDVRAGAFMHPLGANRAYEFLGEVSLGRAAPVH